MIIEWLSQLFELQVQNVDFVFAQHNQTLIGVGPGGKVDPARG